MSNIEMLLLEFVSCNNRSQKCKCFRKSGAINSRSREMRYRCISEITNALCITVLETFRFGARYLVKTADVASTLSQISSTFYGVSAVFSHLGTSFST